MHELFPPLSAESRKALQDLPRILEQVLPQNNIRRRQLPLAIEELSARLTCERGLGTLPYWSAPRLTAAYIWYFLPWNILRLTRLLGGISLPEPTPLPLSPGGEALPRVFADMGSGPLSLPIALWLARPQWRHVPLTLLCLDAAPHPLELGQRIFTLLAGENSPWRVLTLRAPLSALGRELGKVRGVPWLISGANVLNELKGRARGDDQGTGEKLEALVEQLGDALQSPDARALLVEPGTRLGGKTMLTLREAALHRGLTPQSPCPHTADCPLVESRTWCHFTFDVDGAPAWLHGLSQAAHLRKDALSLSFLLLNAGADGPDAAAPAPDAGRIISAPFAVPGVPGAARYVCTERGLALTGKAGGLPSGALVSLRWPEQARKDNKSGASIVEHTEAVEDRPLPRAVRKPISKEGPAAERKKSVDTAEKKERKDKPKKPKAPVKSKKKPEPKFWEK